MNTILLQKILDILTEGLAHVGDFFKDLFISDPQDGQVIGYNGDTGKWTNIDITDLSFDLTNNAGPAEIITITDAAAGMPMNSLIVDIQPKQASGTPTPDNPLPISGRDEVVITKCGKNLYDKSTITTGKYITNTGTEYTSQVGTYSDFIAIKTGVPYYFSHIVGSSAFYSVAVYDNEKTFINTKSISGSADASGTLTFDEGVYIRVNVRIDCIDVCQVEFGNTVTNYEHYQTPTTTTIALPSTVYGGEVDVVSGQGTITKGYIASYNGESINEPWISSMDVYTPGGTPTTGAQVVYPLATPTPITTTPTTIKTQGGTENIWSDTGDVSGEYYTKTAESVLDLANITEDITATITKNTTDFSDILFKASRNNKVVSIEIYSASTSAAVNANFLSGLPKPAMNSKVLLVNTTLGEDGIILGTLKTTGELDITTSGAKTFSGLITYVAK